MFANVGWGEILVLLVVGLVVLGPERLPGAIRWTASALKQARDYLTNTTDQLRSEIGPEFDDLRAPLGELQKLRGMSPRAALTKHLFDGDDSLFTGPTELGGEPARPTPPTGAAGRNGTVGAPGTQAAVGPAASGAQTASGLAGSGTPTPFDPDAT